MPEPLIVVCPNCDSPNRVPLAKLTGGGSCGKCKQPLFSGEPVALDSSNFDTHISRSNIPVVVDFWAPWCAPCRAMAPAFAQTAKELEPQVRLAKVNTEDHQDLAARFGIRSIPTLAIFKNAHEIARQAGAMDVGNLKRWIQSHL